MIAARQISRPIADRILRYSKLHPFLRKRVLIPLGRGLAHLTTRIRMKNLGLGSPVTLAPVSEAAALEQASELMQQVVLFTYSVGVFAGYYFYTKYTTPETVKSEAFNAFKMVLRNVDIHKTSSASSQESSKCKDWPLDGVVSRVILPSNEEYVVFRSDDLVVVEPVVNVVLKGTIYAMRNSICKPRLFNKKSSVAVKD
uniref:Mitofilin n=1 Tax=Syphacia muris TaxID=451379 RepID=A0A0N5A7V9_9BILA